jgi:hypothetical protein
MSRPTFDVLALSALLDGDQAALNRLARLADGYIPCGDCGHEGPHHIQSCMGALEFACSGCGMQHELALPE